MQTFKFFKCKLLSFLSADEICLSKINAQKKLVWETSLGQSLGKSRSARKESRIGSHPILFLTIFPRLWPKLSSRLLVTNVTILLYCMVISSARTGSSRNNTTATSWKLGACFEIFLSKKFFCKLNLTKGFYCTYLKVYEKFFWYFFFFKMVAMTFFFPIHVFQIGWQHKWNNFHPIDSKFCTLFFIRLSSKIRTGFLISEKLSDLWPVFDDFVVKNTNSDFKLTQMYQCIQYFKNMIRILLDLFIINKIKNFVFFTARIAACSHHQQNFSSSWWWIYLIK